MYNDMSYETIKSEILKNIVNIDTREGSFVNDMVSPVSLEIEGVYQALNKILNLMFLTTTVQEYLEMRAFEYGIIRKNGTYSTGMAKFYGEVGAIIPRQTLISTEDNIIFETVEACTIDSQGMVEVEIISTEIGAKNNVLQGTLCNLPVSVKSVVSVENTTVTRGGSDVETDEELRDRVLFQIRTPATSGNSMHYKLWALECEGVGDCKVFPLYYGNGTVMVMPISAQKRALDNTLNENVRTYIDSVNPIGAEIYVEAPTEIFINITAELVVISRTTINQIQKEYEEKLNNYIKESAFKYDTVDLNRCISLLYDCDGINQAHNFKINGYSSNVMINPTEIAVLGKVELEVYSL